MAGAGGFGGETPVTGIIDCIATYSDCSLTMQCFLAFASLHEPFQPSVCAHFACTAARLCMLRRAVDEARARLRTPSPDQPQLGRRGFGSDDGSEQAPQGLEASPVCGRRLCDEPVASHQQRPVDAVTPSSLPPKKRRLGGSPSPDCERAGEDESDDSVGSEPCASVETRRLKSYMLRRLPSSPSGRCASDQDVPWEQRPLEFPSVGWWVAPIRHALAPYYDRMMSAGLKRAFMIDSHSVGTWMENVAWKAMSLPAHDKNSTLSEPNDVVRQFVARAHAGDYSCFYQTMKQQGTGVGHCLGHGTHHNELKPLRKSDVLTGGTLCTPYSMVRGNRKSTPPCRHPDWTMTFGTNCGTVHTLSSASHGGSLLELLHISKARGGILEQSFGFGMHDSGTPGDADSAAEYFCAELRKVTEMKQKSDGTVAEMCLFTAIKIIKMDANLWIEIERPRLGCLFRFFRSCNIELPR